MIRKYLTYGLAGAILLLGGFWAGRDYQVRRHDQLGLAQLDQIYSVLQRKFDGQLDRGRLLDGAKAGFVGAAGDPYTSYLTAEQAKRLNDDLSGTLSGIGAEIGIKAAKLTVIAPVDDSPAVAAGLKAGDYIRAIDRRDTTGMTLDEAVTQIRGQAGTEVTLNISRPGAEPFDVVIKRAVITVKSVRSDLKSGGVGYLEVTRFGADTDELLTAAIKDLRGRGARKFVLDLRNNPGGFLKSSIDVSGHFIKDRLVVEERKNGRTIQRLSSSGEGELAGLPLVVLINTGSASASEIVAGALQDHGAATLVGERSFGKGSVQEIIDLTAGAQLKVTIAHWFTPKGKSIDKDGIKPDVEVKLEQADYDAGRDPQLDRALEILSQR